MALTDGLVGWWSPSQDDTGNGTTTLHDLSGNGNHGTLTNMDAATDWVTDTSNGGVRALDFDGVDDYVDLSSYTSLLPGGTNLFTIASWIMAYSTTAYGGILSRNYGNTNLYVWEGGRCYFEVNGSSSRVFNSTALGGVWHHIIAEYSNDTLALYIDGVFSSSINKTTTLPSQTALYLARRDMYGIQTLTGRLDDIRIYNRVLTPDEITLLASSRVPVESSLNSRRRRLAMGGTL